MNLFQKLWKTKKTRIFMIVCPIVILVFLVVSLVITQSSMISGTFDIVFGGKKAITKEGDTALYTPDFSTKAEAKENGEQLGVKICEEGITLLKNEDNALPLSKNQKVTVFGKNSVNLVYGGSGSSASRGDTTATLYDSLSEAGFEVNPTLKAFYEDNSKSGAGRASSPAMGDIIAGFGTGETPLSSYTSDLRSSYSSYSDAAIVVISRIGGEGYDLPRSMKTGYGSDAKAIDGARSMDDHYLQLDQNETDMIKEACDHFDKVIVVLNTAQVIETGFLDDPNNYAYNSKVKACLWMGLPATKGVLALGEVLNGTVNPSGHTVDTYARNFKEDPTFKNFGNNNTDKGNEYLVGGKEAGYFYVDYEEGIYSGYRYYETRGYEETKKNSSSTWYKDHVVFPFGYGLSYTTFDHEVTWPSGTAITSLDQKIEVNVKVKNTGKVAGKDVVELYVTEPYTEGGIEKSYVELVGFAKTSLIEAGGEDTVTITVKPEDFKSYDSDDANKNGFKGYELEKGNYDLHVASDAHTFLSTQTFTNDKDYQIKDDTQTGTETTNQFDDVSSGIVKQMSRADFEGTFPSTPTTEDRTMSQDFIDSLTYTKNDSGKPWEATSTPTTASSEVAKDQVTVTLRDLVGKDYNDPKWDELLSQLTLDQMATLIGTGAYGTIALENIGKPLTNEPDGPSGFTSFMAMSDSTPVYGCAFYPAETVLGSTWNTTLAHEMGVAVGNEGLIGNERGDKLPYSGWYAPAVNIHRSPFGGRNWEYYSEDALLSGKMGAEVVKGCKEKGVYCFVKHFSVNEQETNRDSEGCMVWLREQTLREVYLKPFEIIVKEAKTTAMMSSFTRLGKTWCGGDYYLLTQVLRKEWGFVGEVVTDYNLLRYMNVNQMIRAGGDLVLNQSGKSPSLKNVDATQATCIYNATHNILYTIANSNAMNSEIVGYRMADWKMLLIIVDCVVAGLLVVWGAIVITLTLRKKPTPSIDGGDKNSETKA